MIIERDVIKKIERSVQKDTLTVIIGARQVGKTFAMMYLKERLEKDGEKVYYFDLEHIDQQEVFNKTNEALKYLNELSVPADKKSYIFIDEVQYLNNPSNLLKILADHYKHLKVVVSGSSTLKIRDKFKDSLAGRKEVITMYPLTFGEYLLFSGDSALAKLKKKINLRNVLKEMAVPEVSSLTRQAFGSFFESFALYGGYPKQALTQKRDDRLSIIQEIFDSYILKDIKDFAHIDDVGKFNSVVKFLAVQNGGLFNSQEVSKELGISRITLNKYLFILENTFSIRPIPPYHTNRQKEITKMHKTFFIDTGMRNFVLKDFRELSLREDAGSLIENVTVNEIEKDLEILEEVYFWRTPQKQEVDCILRREGGEVIPIEVKYRSFQSPQLTPGLKAFIRNYKPKKAVMLTRDYFGTIDFETARIVFLPAWAV